MEQALDGLSKASWALLSGEPVDWGQAGGLIVVVGPGLEATLAVGVQREVHVFTCGVCERVGQAVGRGRTPSYCY
jgi:hypothetical protein